MSAAVALHLVVLLTACATLARELARTLAGTWTLRVAYAGPRVVRPWRGTVIARPWSLGARVSEAPLPADAPRELSTPPRRRRAGQLALPVDAPGNDNEQLAPALRPAPGPRETWPHHVAVEISTGFRVYRLKPGDRWQTREEVEVHGTLVGWCERLAGTALPKGMTAADVAALPRAARAPAPAPLAVEVTAWCALPVDARDFVRWRASASKGPGVIALGAMAPYARLDVEGLLTQHGLVVIERSAEQIVWGSP